MGFYTGTTIDLVKKSLDANYLMHTVLALIIWFFLFALSSVISLCFGFIAYNFFKFSLTGLIIYGIIVILFFVFLAIVQTIATGIGLNLAKQFEEGKAVQFSQAWNDTKSRFWVLFKVNFLISMVFFLLSIILLLPAILLFIGLIVKVLSSGNFLEAWNSFIVAFPKIIISLIGGILILLLIQLILLPFFALYQQVALFEQEGMIGSIKRTIYYAKKNFGMTLLMVFVFGIAMLVIGLLIGLVQTIFDLVFLILPFIGIIIGIVFFVARTIWSTGIGWRFSYKIYKINAERS